MEVKVATHVGRVRENNEDAFWVAPSYLVVCDGMGGHSAGEVASELAIKVIREFPFTGVDPQSELKLAIDQAQEHILELATTDLAYAGMGTTITLAWITPLVGGDSELVLAHVGDSRAYAFIDGNLAQLTTDHSVVNELVRSGNITPQEAKEHTKRHMLTQALGSPKIELELIQKSLPSGALILLCTDGLTDVVEDERIAKILQGANSSENIAQDLVDLANELGGPDNITVIVAQLS